MRRISQEGSIFSLDCWMINLGQILNTTVFFLASMYLGRTLNFWRDLLGVELWETYCFCIMESFSSLKNIADGQSAESWELSGVYMARKYSQDGGSKNCCQDYFPVCQGSVKLHWLRYLSDIFHCMPITVTHNLDERELLRKYDPGVLIGIDIDIESSVHIITIITSD